MRKHIYGAIVYVLLVGNTYPMKRMQECLGIKDNGVHPEQVVDLRAFPVEVVRDQVFCFLGEQDLYNVLVVFCGKKKWRKVLPTCHKKFPLVCAHARLSFEDNNKEDLLWKDKLFSKKECALYAARNDHSYLIAWLLIKCACLKETCTSCQEYGGLDKANGIPHLVVTMLKHDAHLSFTYFFDKTNFLKKQDIGVRGLVAMIDKMCVLAVRYGSVRVHKDLMGWLEKLGDEKSKSYGYVKCVSTKQYSGGLQSGYYINADPSKSCSEDVCSRAGGSLLVLAYYNPKHASTILQNILDCEHCTSLLKKEHVQRAVQVATHNKNVDIARRLRKLELMMGARSDLEKALIAYWYKKKHAM